MKKIIIPVSASGIGGMLSMLGLQPPPEAPVKDKVRTPPDLQGQGGKAWRFDIEKLRTNTGNARADDATIVAWMVEAPWAHPVWHSYIVLAVHLRDIGGLDPAVRHLADATHEIIVVALNPDQGRQKLLTGEVVLAKAVLYPLNFAAQFIEVEDKLAADRIDTAVKLITEKKLSPDTDHLPEWADMFGWNMVKRD